MYLSDKSDWKTKLEKGCQKLDLEKNKQLTYYLFKQQKFVTDDFIKINFKMVYY